MKKITELTSAEILALTNDNLDTMVKIEMAEQGIKILTRPKEPEYIAIPEKDKVVYAIGGSDVFFENQEHAKIIADAINSVKQFAVKSNYDRNYDLRYVKKISDDSYDFNKLGNISTENFYLKSTIEDIEENVRTNEKLKKQYEQQLSEYNDAYSSAKDIREGIYESYQLVIDKKRHMDDMKHKYLQYLSLAENNTTVAMNFLKKAYAVDEETEEFILK